MALGALGMAPAIHCGDSIGWFEMGKGLDGAVGIIIGDMVDVILDWIEMMRMRGGGG